MMPLHRTSVGSCAVLVALALAASLLYGGRKGSFHILRTAVTPTVKIAGLPAPELPAGASEVADLDRLAGSTLVLFALASATALATLLGLAASENVSLEARRIVEVMLGAPPRWLTGSATRLWGRRVLQGMAAGGVLCAAGTAAMVDLAPPGISFGRPSALAAVGVLAILGVLVAATAVMPVRRLYRRGMSPFREAENLHLTDPRPRQFHRVLLITLQLAVAVSILTVSGLFLLSDDESRTSSAADHAVVGILSATGEAAGDPEARAALFGAVLSALEDAPELVAESLATPGAWIDRGPEAVALNECGNCSTGGMPHPMHGARVKHHAVMPGFFAGRGLRVVDGRGFKAGGLPTEGAGELVISLAYARAHFQDPPVIGRQVALGGMDGGWHVVVGVVDDVGAAGLGASGSRYSVYYSAFEHPPAAIELVAALAGSSVSGPDDSLRVVRESLAALPAPGLVLDGLRPAADELARVYGTVAWLGGGSRFAGLLAALVAVAGMVGAIRVHVRARLREMGIRGALGAEPGSLGRMIMGEALRIGGAGVGLGLWGATLVAGILGPPGVGLFSAPLFLAVATLFLLSSAGAALPGARLASSAEPASVMRS